MHPVRRTSVLSVALIGTAWLVVGCSPDSSTSPISVVAAASKGSGGGSGSSGGGGGGKDGGGASPTQPPVVLTGPVYLRESFGFDPLGNHVPIRFDAAGDTVRIGIGTALDGFRAEFPNTGSEVWMSPDVRQQPAWGFAQSTVDPSEPFSPFEVPGVDNGIAASEANPTTISNNDALVPFIQPEGAVTASITAYGGPYTIAIGFTPSGVLTDNFETAGAAWLVVRVPQQNFFSTPGTWELHTNGLTGQTVSGTFVASTFNKIAVSFDPSTGTVVGSVLGAPTPALHYSVTGVKYVGFQGHGIVNDFHVVAGSITSQ